MTGISVMQCKLALAEAEGDKNKAVEILKKISGDIALKKAARDTKDGAVMIKNDDKKSVLVSLRCETDFVSRNEDFISLLKNLTKIAFSEGLDKMLEKAKELIDPIIQKTGEKIELGENYLVEGKILGNYVHNDKKGGIVSLEEGTPELAREIAMHLVAMQPENIDTLLDQPFIKNPSETVGQLLQKAKARIKEIRSYSI